MKSSMVAKKVAKDADMPYIAKLCAIYNVPVSSFPRAKVALTEDDIKSIKDVKSKYVYVQAGLRKIQDFLLGVNEVRADIVSRYNREIEETNAMKKYMVPWMNALQNAAETNREKRRVAGPQQKKAYAHERESCTVKDCYAAGFRDGLCVNHYALKYKLDVKDLL